MDQILSCTSANEPLPAVSTAMPPFALPPGMDMVPVGPGHHSVVHRMRCAGKILHSCNLHPKKLSPGTISSDVTQSSLV